MEKKELISLLQSTYLFRGVANDSIETILSSSKIITLPQNTYVVREGEVSNEIFLLIRGEVEVVKEDGKNGHLHRLAVLGGVELIGEMSLIDQSPRSASVITLADSELLVITNLSQLEAFQASYAQIVKNISANLAKRLRTTDETTVNALEAELQGAQTRNEMGRFLFAMLVVLSMWIFAVNIVDHYSANKVPSAAITLPLLVVLFCVSLSHVISSIYPISFYGLNLNNWKRNAWEGFLFSLPLLLIAFIAKIAFVRYLPMFEGSNVINYGLFDPTSSLSPLVQILLIWGYVVFVPVQEFIGRGTIQSSLYVFLAKRSPFWSIILSSLLFATFHSQISSVFALAAFVGGLFWGWLYARQKSLVGTIVSHALIGLVLFGFLGLDKLFENL